MSTNDDSIQHIEDLLLEEPTYQPPRLPCTCIKRRCHHRIAWAKQSGVLLSPIVKPCSIYAGPEIPDKSPSKRKVQFDC